MKKRLLAMLLTVCMVFTMLPMTAFAAWIDDVPLAAVPEGDEVHGHIHEVSERPTGATDAAHLAEVTEGETEPTEPGEGQQWAYLAFTSGGPSADTGFGFSASPYNIRLWNSSATDENDATKKVAQVEADGIYKIRVGTGSYARWMHVVSGYTKTNLCIGNEEAPHQFRFVDAGEGFYKIKSVNGNLYLRNVVNGDRLSYLPQHSLEQYTQIQVTADETAAAKFKVEPVDGQTGVYTIKTIINVYNDGASLPSAFAADYSGADINPATYTMSATSAHSATSGNTEGPVTYANDNNVGTWWHTNYPAPNLATTVDKRILTVELATEQKISAFRYKPRNEDGNGFVTKYAIEVSTDNAEWKAVAAGTWNSRGQRANWQIANFKPVSAKYVRLVGIETAGSGGDNQYMHAAEVRVVGMPLLTVDQLIKSGSLASAGMDNSENESKLYGDADTTIRYKNNIAAGDALTLDFGQIKEVDRVRIVVGGHSENLRDKWRSFKLEYSQNGKDWTQIGTDFSGTDNDEKNIWDLAMETPVNARYLRLFNNTAQTLWAGFGRFAAWGENDLGETRTVTFVDGETFTESQVAWGADAVLPPAPTKDGYTFIGWFYTKDDGTTAELTAATQVTEDMTVTAQWAHTGAPNSVRYINKNSTSNAFTLGTNSALGCSLSAVGTENQDLSVMVPGEWRVWGEGLAFLDATVQDDGALAAFSTGSIGNDGPRTLQTFELQGNGAYHISIERNGATYYLTNEVGNYGGRECLKYSSDVAEAADYYITPLRTRSLSVWTVIPPATHTVAFVNGTERLEASVIDGEAVGSVPGAAAPEGQTFLGWYTEAGELIHPNTPVTADITAEAYFATTAELAAAGTTDGNVAATASAPSTATDGNYAAANVLDNDGETIWHSQWDGTDNTQPNQVVNGKANDYTFAGDNYLQLDLGSVKTLDAVRYLPRNSMAGRILKYTVRVSENGTDYMTVGVGTKTADDGSCTVVSFKPINAQYVRLYAHLTCNSVGEAGDNNMTIAELHAVTVPVTVTFKNGEDTVATAKVRPGGFAALPENPTKEGYVFSGWFDGENELTATTPVNAAMTVTAKWERDTATAVAKIGGTYYWTLAEALAAVEAGQTVELLADADLYAAPVTFNKDVTAKLATGTYLVTGPLTVNAGTLTVNGNFKSIKDHQGANDHNFVVNGGKLVVEGGLFTAGCTVVYVTGHGEAEVKGGDFTVSNTESYGNKYLLNLKDDALTTASITVTGGSFHDYDPAQGDAGHPQAQFVPAALATQKDDNGVVTIVDAKAQLIDVETGTAKGYTSVEAAIAAADLGDTVKLLADATVVVPNDKAVQIDENGFEANIDCQARALGGNGNAFAIYGGLEAVVEAEPLVRAEKKPQSTTTYIYLRKSVQLKDDIYLPSRNATTMGIYTEAEVTIDLNGHNITQQSSQETSAPGLDGNAAVVACADTTIQGNGTITGAAIGLTTYKGGKITLRDATVTTKGSFYGNTWWGSVVHLMGGEFNMVSGKLVLPTAENAKYDGAFWVPGNAFEAAKVTIIGGEIETGTASLVANENLAGRPAPTYAITGGTFDMDLTGATDAAGNKYLSSFYWSPEEDVDTFVVREKFVAQLVMSGHTVDYHTVQEAVNAAGGFGYEVKLLADVTESINVPSETNIALNLNKHKLTNEPGKDTITVAAESSLTIQGNGTVDNESHQKAALVNEGGYVTLKKGVVVTRSEENGKDNTYYNIVNHGYMYINGATVKQTGNFSSLIENGYYDGTKKPAGVNVELTIYDGAFSGGLNTIKNDDWGRLNISGGTFTNAAQAVILNWNVAEISGGDFTLNAGGNAVVLNGGGSDMDLGKLDIMGGNFQGNGAPALKAMNGNEAYMKGVQVSDGTFSNDVSDYCVDGKKAVTEDNVAWTITDKTYVAQIGEAKFETLQAAIDAAQPGDTVLLTANVREKITVAADKELTLDLNGFTVDGPVLPGKETGSVLTNEGKLTITDNSEGGEGKITRTEDGLSTAKTDHDGHAYIILNNGELTLAGGTIEGRCNREANPPSTIANGTKKAATLTITGGKVTNTIGIAVKNDENGKLIVTGGQMDNDTEAYQHHYNVVQNWAQAEITGGVIAGDVGTWTYANTNATTKLGGNVTVTGKVRVEKYDEKTQNTPVTEITGGWFGNDVNEFCVNHGQADGFCWNKDSHEVKSHVWPEEWTVDQPATCVAVGSQTKTCGRCGEKLEEEIPVDPTAHALVEVAEIPAQVGVAGVQAHQECSLCGKLFRNGEEVEASALVIPARTVKQVIEEDLDSYKFVGILASQPNADEASTLITATVDSGYNGTLTIPYGKVDTGKLTLGVGMKGVESLGMASGEKRSHVLDTKLGNKKADLNAYKEFLTFSDWQGFGVNTTVVNPGQENKTAEYTFAVENAADKVSLKANTDAAAARAAWKAIFQNTTAPVGANDSKIVVKEGSYFQAGTKKVVLQQPGDLVVDNFQNLNMAALRAMFQVTEVSESSKATLFLKKGTTLAVGTSSVTLTKDVTISSDNLKEADVAQMVQLTQMIASGALDADTQKQLISILLSNIVYLPSTSIEGGSTTTKVPMNLTIEFACEHVWNEGEITTPATCVAEGEKTYTCTICKETKTEPVAIDPAAHKLVEVARVEPTVEAEGTKEHFVCELCGKLFDIESKEEVTAEDLILAKLEGVAAIGDKQYTTLQAAVEAAQANDVIKLLMNVDLTTLESGYNVMDISGVTLDLNGKTITSENNNSFVVFQGVNAKIMNGTFAVTGGSYALFVGDNGDTDNFVIENVTTAGVNIYNATNVTLRDVTSAGTAYYSVWCDPNGHATIESGTYSSASTKANALFGLSKTESSMEIKGGTFTVAEGQKFALPAPEYNQPVITGGTFNTNVNEWCKDHGQAEGYCQDQTSGVVGIHAAVKHDAKAPTCTEKGWNAYVTCSKCDYTTYEEIAALGHEMTKTDAKAPTCTDKGNVEYWSCATCGKNFADEKGETELETVEIAALGHKMTETEAVDATCTEAGNTAYWTCETCKKVFSDEAGTQETTLEKTVIAALGHKLVLVAEVPAQVDKDGVKAHYVCENDNCGAKFQDAEGKTAATEDWLRIPALVGVAAVGETKYATVQAAINAAGAGETVTLLQNVTENVTVAEGKTLTLDLNGQTINGDLAAKPKAGSVLTNEGNLTITDSKGNGMITRDESGATSHTGHDYIILNNGTLRLEGGTIAGQCDRDKAPSTIANGTKKSAILTIVGGKVTNTTGIAVKNDENGELVMTSGEVSNDTAAHGHNFDAIQNWKIADITGGTVKGNVGTWTYNSTRAATNLGGSVNVQGTVHVEKYDEQTENTPTTEITGGTYTNDVNEFCANHGLANGFCWNSETKQVAKHTVSAEWSTDGTNHWHTCATCDVKLDNAAHTAAEAVRENVKDSTCAVEGSYDEVVYCSVCELELSRTAKTIEKKAHTPGEAVRENVVDSTCSKEGSYDEVVYCSECNAELSREAKIIEKKDHTVETDDAVAPTYKTTGLTEGSHCSVCGETLVEQTVVPMLKLAAVTAYGNGVVTGSETAEVTVVFDADSDELVFAADANGFGRAANKWWAGIHVADAEKAANAKYQKIGQWWLDAGESTDWTAPAAVQADGQYWAMATPAYMEQLKGADNQLMFRYAFDWNNDGETDQTVTVLIKDTVKFSDAGKIAETNGVAYPTVQEAIDAAGAKGSVKLLKDTTESVTVAAGKDITLDLNGKTLNGPVLGKNTGSVLTNEGTLVIKDSVGNGKITRDETGETNHSGHAYIILNNGELTLESGTIEGTCLRTKNPPSTIANGTKKAATLTIKGGKVTNELGIAVKNDENGKLVMTGGEVTTYTAKYDRHYNAVQNWKDAEITGGVINGDVETWTYEETTALTKLSGTVEVKGDVTQEKYDAETKNDPETQITGGKYATDVNKYCADGFCWSPEDHTVAEHVVKTAWDKDATQHWHTCDHCQRKYDAADHSWTESKVVKAATCTEKGTQEFTCECGATKTEEIAALGHNMQVVPNSAKAPTCAADGKEADKKCVRCDHTEEGAVIPATGEHTWGEWTVVTKATCAAKGSEKRVCSVCDAEETRETEKNADNHAGETEVRNAKAATCTEGGYTGDTYCLGCDKVIATGETTEALGHDMVEVEGSAVAATCTTDGKEADKACSRCDHTETGAVIKAAGHAWNDGVVTTEPGCETPGVKTYTCATCGATKTEAMDALGHDYADEFTVDQAATCTTPGSQSKHCSRCDAKTDVTEIPVIAHSWNDGVITTPATCVATGEKTYTCTACDATRTEEVAIDPANHVGETELRNVRAATCTDEGYTGDTYCVSCGTKIADGQATQALGHNTLGYVAHKDATCTEAGVAGGHYCDRCDDGKAAAEAVLPALNHNMVVMSAGEAATCTEAGVHAYWKCVRCEKLYSDAAGNTETTLADTVIPALGHDLTHVAAVERGCETAGTVEHWHCGRCGKNFAEEACENELATVTLPAKGHTFVASEDNKAATCTQPGWENKTVCADCGEVQNTGRLVPALGHDLVEVAGTAQAATCTEAGKEADKACSRCDHTETGAAIAALGHHMTMVEASAATCETAGNLQYWSCDRCDKLFRDVIGNTETTLADTVIPALGHDEVTVAHKDATCTEPGVAGGTYCRRCEEGKAAAEAVIPALGHTLTHHEAVAATCTEKGSVEHWSCATCGKNFAEETAETELTTLETAALGHTLTHHEAVAATCAEKGSVEYWSCETCGKNFAEETAETELETVETEALGHDFTKFAFDANGHWHVCAHEGCEEKMPDETPAAHTWDNGTVSGNIRTFTCTAGCGATRTETVSTGGGGGGGGGTSRPTPPTPPTPPEEDLNEPDVPLAKPFMFTDVTENDWFYDAVKFVYEKDIMVGINDEGTLFGPGLDTTRATVATIIHRAENKPAAEAASFSDVLAGMWYTDAVAWTDKSGVMIGFGDGTFGPAINVTREQLVTVFYRYAKLLDRDVSASGDLTVFDDAADVSVWASEAMTWAVGCGLIKGRDGNRLAPQETTTRGELATILQRFLTVETQSK